MTDRFTEPFDDEPISPELVLVDPVLAARVRARAVAVRTPLEAPMRPVAAVRVEVRAAAPTTHTTVVAGRARRRRRSYVGWAIAMLALVVLLGVGFAGPRDAPSLGESGPQATPALTLTWQPVDAADYYLVEIFRSLRLVHAESVGTNHLGAPSWLAPGRYTWTVRAGTGAPIDRETGQVFEQGWFLVTR